MGSDDRRAAYERRFRRAGLPLLIEDFSASTNVYNRVVPLLVFVFLAEMLGAISLDWPVLANVGAVLGGLAILAALFVALGTSFLVARLPGEVRSLEREAGGQSPELDGPQRLNVGLVLFVSQALQVLFVSIAVGAFFVVLGVLLVDAGVLHSWIGSDGHVLIRIHYFGNTGIVTEELLRVSGAIAALTGLYFAISMLTDDVYRREFLDELTSEMRDTFRARAEYVRLAGAT